MPLERAVRHDLICDPNGAPLSLVEAAIVLGLTPGRVGELVRDGKLAGRLEDQRPIGVSRKAVLRRLGLG